MNRRRLLQAIAGAIPLLPAALTPALPQAGGGGAQRARVRPGDPGWPSESTWQQLNRETNGQLIKINSPLSACMEAPASPRCAEVFRQLKNPYFLGDEPGLTQTLGWVDGWTFKPSVYALAARHAKDVAAGINFARNHNLRVAVKGGGHSYQGTSSAPDSLLIWTRRMNTVTLHDAFVGAGCAGRTAPQPAATVEAGAMWGHTYDAVTTKGGRYVQGGGCMTVGVAGLIQSGGFGSFSKKYGMAAASLLEAEIVTADGEIRIANACTNPDLFWGIKGGGGGSLGVITRLTLRTHDLPEFFGAVFTTIKATSDDAFRRLIARTMNLYADALLNPHWGEQIAFRRGNLLEIAMVFQGLRHEEAHAIWRPFFEWIEKSPQDYSLASAPMVLAAPARNFWSPEFLAKLPGLILADDRAGASSGNIFWATNQREAAQVLHAYQSAWIPVSLLRQNNGTDLVSALFAATRHWSVSLHVNKGLAGSPPEAVGQAKDTATNPAVLDAFALAISGAEGPPAYPGVAGREPDVAAARRDAAAVGRAMDEMRKLLPTAGSYVSESNFFDDKWQESFWGTNYPRLLSVKEKYDPDGLFFVHHGVGSERWSPDGFTKLR